MEDRLKRIQLLRRKDERKRHLPEFLKSMQLATGHIYSELDCTSQEKYDEYHERFSSALKECMNGYNCINLTTPRFSNEFNGLLNKVALAIGDEQIYFCNQEGYYCGCVKVRMTDILRNIDQVLKYFPDELMLMGEGVDCGLFIDLFEDYRDYTSADYERIEFIQFVVWGNKWMDKIGSNR